MEEERNQQPKADSRQFWIVAIILLAIGVFMGLSNRQKELAAEEARYAGTSVPATTAPASELPQISQSRKNAVDLAQEYVDGFPYSRYHLRQQLQEDGTSWDDARYAVNNVKTDWQSHADLRAKAIVLYNIISRKGLLEQLKLDEYTDEEAAHAAENCGASWMQMASLRAAQLLKQKSYTRMQMIVRLTDDGFTQQEAEYGATENGLK